MIPASGVDAELERVAARWWPAEEVEPAGPWLLRAAGGFTGRANSVAALGEVAPGQVPDLLDRAAAFYRSHGLPLRLQVADTPRTDALRRTLAALDFAPERGDGDVLVMVRPLDDTTATPGAHDVVHGDEPDDAWVDCWWSVTPREDPAAGRALLERVPRPRSFARVLAADGAPVAVGLAARVDDWVGLGAIAVLPSARRRGLGRRLTIAMLAAGAHWGASRAFLQVSTPNRTARRLYEQLGFTTAYRYRYWRPAGPQMAGDTPTVP